MADWDRRFLEMAKLVSTWSKDPSTKCGAVIVRPDKTVAGVGFNGFPQNTSDASDHYNDRTEKLGRIVHAEANALLFTKESVYGYTMYAYQEPTLGICDSCASFSIQTGIARVVHSGIPWKSRWWPSIERGLKMYEEAGVEVIDCGPCNKSR